MREAKLELLCARVWEMSMGGLAPEIESRNNQIRISYLETDLIGCLRSTCVSTRYPIAINFQLVWSWRVELVKSGQIIAVILNPDLSNI